MQTPHLQRFVVEHVGLLHGDLRVDLPTGSPDVRAIQVHQPGGPDALRLADVGVPVPEPTEVLARVHAAGINPVDWKTRAGAGVAGLLGPTPWVLGWDVSGVVDQLVGWGHPTPRNRSFRLDGSPARLFTINVQTIALQDGVSGRRGHDEQVVGADSAVTGIRSANGGGLRFGAQHSQSVENRAMAVPGLKVVAPSTPADVVGLLVAAVRDHDPVVFFEQKSLYPTKGEVPDGEIVDRFGTAKVLREGRNATIVALAAMVPRALAAAERLAAEEGIETTVVDVRCLVPLDTRTILSAVSATSRVFTIEENPRLCGWGAEVASIVAEECFWDLDEPVVRITTPHIPLPSAAALEDLALPSVDRIVETVRKGLK